MPKTAPFVEVPAVLINKLLTWERLKSITRSLSITIQGVLEYFGHFVFIKFLGSPGT